MATTLLLVEFAPPLAAHYQDLFTAVGYSVRTATTTTLAAPNRALPDPALVLFAVGVHPELDLGQALAALGHPILRGVPLLLVVTHNPSAIAGRDLSWAAGQVTLPITDADLLAKVAQLLTPAPRI